MKNLKFNKQSTAMLCALSILFFSFSSSFPTSRTGAPGESTCGACHANNGGFSGDISIDGLPSTVMANTTYNLTVTLDVTGGNPVRAGFSTTALDDSNSAAGDWSNAGSNGTIKNAMGREYFGHDPAISFGGGGSVSWDADWTAPNISDDVTFYISSILANGSGTGGDNVLLLEETVTVMQPAAAISITFTNISAPTCNGDDDGFAEAVAANGTAPYEYEWDNGATTAGANLTGGLHSVTVTDDTGATEEAVVDIPEPDVLEIDADVTDVLCNGDSDGSIEIFASGGTGNIDCTWDNLPDGCVQNNLAAGTYTVTIEDENGCTEFESITISQPSALQNAFIQVVNESMPGAADGSATVTVSGGTMPYSYTWDTGANTQTITGLTAGIYCVTIEDNNGCDINTCAQVMTTSAPCNITLNSNVMDVNCAGQSSGAVGLFVMGGTGTLSYAWSNNTSNANITNVPAGMYSVTVTDMTGCTQSLNNITVAQPEALAVSLTQSANASCANSLDGSLSLAISGGTEPYAINWSNGSTTTTIMNLNPGTYSYTMTDANGCTSTGEYVIGNDDSEAPLLMLQEATVTLDANGTAAPLSFNAVGTATDNCMVSSVEFVTPSFTCSDIGINSYTVVATDSNGNTSTGVATVQVIETIDPVINCASSTITTNTCGAVSYVLPTATDNCDTPVVTLLSGLASGSVFPTGESMVSYIALDACGNSSSCTFTVTVINDLSANVTTTPGSCGSSSGSITIGATGGTPPYASSPLALGTTSNLAPGNYSVTITDSGGCTATQSATIGSSDGPIITLIGSEPALCTGNDSGVIIVEASGGTPPYQYQLNTGQMSNTTSDAFTFFDLIGATYIVSILDANNCLAEISVVIPNLEGPDIAFGDIELDCFGDSLAIDLEMTFQDFTIEGLPPIVGVGIYDLIVTDNNTGCTTTEQLEVTGPLAPLAIGELMTSDTGDCTFSVEVEVTGGTAPYDVEIIRTGPDLQGPYTVSVVDANGCQASSSQMIEEISFSALEMQVNVEQNCNTAMITPTVIGGCPPYNFVINPPTPLGDGSFPPGSYEVEVVDQNGNSITSNVDIVGVDIQTSNVEIFPFSDVPGQIFLDITGGTAPYAYSWVDPAGNVISTEEDLGAAPGTATGEVITLTVTDANGCIAVFTFMIPFENSTVDLDSDNTLMSIYPNPVVEALSIAYYNSLPDRVEIYKITGQKIFTDSVKSYQQTIDTRTLDPGLYLLKSKFGDRYVVKRFVKI